MDPISKALERARRDGQSVRQWVQPGPVAQASAVAEIERSDRDTMQLDPSVLHKNNLLSGSENEDPIVTDRYRLLRTRVLQIMRANGWRSLGVTSPGPKAGKTVTSVNLALSIAREGNYRVTLVDADIRKPSAAEYMGVEHPVGLPDFLDRRANLEDILIEISEPARLSFISGESGSPERPAPDILKRDRMSELLETSAASGIPQLVVVDLPPVLIGDDVIAVAASLDALLLVVDENSTSIDDLEQSVELLSEFSLVGTVLNKSTEKPNKDSGYYHYHHQPQAEKSPSAATQE